VRGGLAKPRWRAHFCTGLAAIDGWHSARIERRLCSDIQPLFRRGWAVCAERSV